MSSAHNPRVIEELRDRIAHLEGSAAYCPSASVRWTIVCQEAACLMGLSTRSPVAGRARRTERRPHCSPPAYGAGKRAVVEEECAPSLNQKWAGKEANPQKARMPFLLDLGTEEDEQTRAWDEALMSWGKKLLVLGPETGADAHCQGNNPRHLGQEVPAWLPRYFQRNEINQAKPERNWADILRIAPSLPHEGRAKAVDWLTATRREPK